MPYGTPAKCEEKLRLACSFRRTRLSQRPEPDRALCRGSLRYITQHSKGRHCIERSPLYDRGELSKVFYAVEISTETPDNFQTCYIVPQRRLLNSATSQELSLALSLALRML